VVAHRVGRGAQLCSGGRCRATDVRGDLRDVVVRAERMLDPVAVR
jgi:hypothetical protein